MFDASGAGNWCDHWKQCVWFIPGKGMSICKGEELLFHALHTQTSVSYELKSQIPITDERQHNLNAKDFQLALPPERIAIYGDGEWRLSMVMAMRNAVRSSSLLACLFSLKTELIHSFYHKSKELPKEIEHQKLSL